MRHVSILTLCIFAVLSLGMGKKATFSVSFHLQADREASKKRVVPIKIDGEAYNVSRIPEITHRDFASFVPFQGSDGVSIGGAFKLKPNAARRLTAVSQTNQGKILFAKVNRSVVDEVVIDMPVTDGWIIIWKGITPEVAAELKKKYGGGR